MYQAVGIETDEGRTHSWLSTRLVFFSYLAMCLSLRPVPTEMKMPSQGFLRMNGKNESSNLGRALKRTRFSVPHGELTVAAQMTLVLDGQRHQWLRGLCGL